MERAIIVLIFLVAAIAGACSLLPERYAVNAPLGNLIFGRGIEAPEPEVVVQRIRAPANFGVGIWARGIPGARMLHFTPRGDLLVSAPGAGRIHLLERDADGDGMSDGARVLIDGLQRPHGLDLHGGWLYVAEMSGVGRIRFDAAGRETSGSLERVVTDLPSGGNHWTRSLRFGPDGWMYVSIGSSCNVCEEEDPRRAAIVRYRPDGSGEEIYATGLRNAVGFDWRPGTGELFATENGRDLLGDDFPPCELNRIERGGFYGWPYASGANVLDPDLGPGHEERIQTAKPPVHGFRAHTAPLGITFLRGDALPASYQGAALVALHGSWNRTRKDGYQVVSLSWLPDGSVEERYFLIGFEFEENVIGRPVDVAEGPDGAIYVSDDYAGVIYRVAYDEERLRELRVQEAATAAARAELEALRAEDPLTRFQPKELATRLEGGLRKFERAKCGSCHDPARAEPGVQVVELKNLRGRYTFEELGAVLTDPPNPMPLTWYTPAERINLTAYLFFHYP